MRTSLHLRTKPNPWRKADSIVGSRRDSTRWLTVHHKDGALTLFLDDGALEQLADALETLKGTPASSTSQAPVWVPREDGDGSYIDPALEARVAEAVRRYPDSTAESWLAPTAAILEVVDWIDEAGYGWRYERPGR